MDVAAQYALLERLRPSQHQVSLPAPQTMAIPSTSQAPSTSQVPSTSQAPSTSQDFHYMDVVYESEDDDTTHINISSFHRPPVLRPSPRVKTTRPWSLAELVHARSRKEDLGSRIGGKSMKSVGKFCISFLFSGLHTPFL